MSPILRDNQDFGREEQFIAEIYSDKKGDVEIDEKPFIVESVGREVGHLCGIDLLQIVPEEEVQLGHKSDL